MPSPAEHLLEQHGIRPTANRILLTKHLSTLQGPATQKELELSLLTLDKSVVSRTLSLMVERGLVHQIPGPQGTYLYELCHADHNHDEDDDEHAHFCCTGCGCTLCLHDTTFPDITLPAGFQMQHAHYVITGLCPRCAKKSSPSR